MQKNVINYDRSYKLPAIVDLSKVREEDKPKFIEALKASGAVELRHPADFAAEVAQHLAKHGYPRFATMPTSITGQESLVLVAECLKRFNPFALLRRLPDTNKVNRTVVKSGDYARIVEELVSQQDNISLSQIWASGNFNTKAGYTLNEHLTDSRLTWTVIKVPRNPASKKNDDRVERLMGEIQMAFEITATEEYKDKEEAKYRLS